MWGKQGFAVLFVLGISQSVLATTFVNRPLGDVLKETPIVARGRTGESYSQWDKSGRKQIFTYTNFVVTEVLKGELKETRILLRQPGGEVGGTAMNVPGTANFANEEDVVVLLGEKNKDDESYDVPGFATGKYEIVPGDNGEPMLVNSLGGGAIYDPNKDPRTMSYNSKIPLEVFRRVAKGEDIPEAAHRQYEGSMKNAPHGAYDADHARHAAPEHRPAAEASSTPSAAPSAEAEVAPSSSHSLWIPLSFAAIALVGAFLLWRMLTKKGE